MRTNRNQYLLPAIIFGLLALAWFALRGPHRMRADSHDFETIYTSTRAWLHGSNPYDHQVLTKVWEQAGGSPDRAPNKATTPSVYPITTFVLMTPLGLLPWHAAQLLWCACNLVAIVVLLESLRRLLQLKWSDTNMVLLAAFAIGLRSFSNAIQLGQTSLVVTAMGAITILLANRDGRISGVLYALMLAIKAPLAAAFLVPEIMARRIKPLVIAAVLLVILLGIGAAKAGNPHSWISLWRDNLRSASVTGAVNDPSTANEFRHQLINLQYPLATSITDLQIVNAITWLLGIALAVPAVLRLKDKPLGEALLLPLSCICIVELFVTYHRLYDATLLVFPIAWALLPTTPRWQAWPALALITIMILPGSGPLLTGSAQKLWIYNRFILPRDAWSIFFLGSWLSLCCQTRPAPASELRLKVGLMFLS